MELVFASSNEHKVNEIRAIIGSAIILKSLNDIAQQREQTLAQMALVWLLKDPRVTSVLIGASSVKQLEENVAALNNGSFSIAELKQIELILTGGKYSIPKHEPKEMFTPKKTNDNTPSRGDFIKNLAKRVGNQK